jgi:uncharacterized protein (DUF2249 family)
MKRNVVTLDVREEIRQGREPFTLIMRTVMQLKPTDSLLLIAPFEPAPLYGVLGNKGFSHQTKTTPDGSWEILFERPASEKPSAAQPSSAKPASVQTAITEVDARGLEPPQPMVKILEAVAALPRGEEMRAHTDRRPMHLLAQLDERGFTGQTEEQPDGSYLTHIRHR